VTGPALISVTLAGASEVRLMFESDADRLASIKMLGGQLHLA
jgi:hypothetical protein